MNVMVEYLKVCEEAVRAGGAVLLEKIGRVQPQEKGQADLVTEADYASQEVIRRTVLDAFDGHGFVGEEGEAGPGSTSPQAEYRWIADPLDGTTNFVHQVPHFCVSLALERSGQLLVGAVYHPVAEEYYVAASGQGAWLNGQPIRTSNLRELSQTLSAVGLPAVVKPDSPDLLVFLEALSACQAVRRSGSVALNLAYVASGRFDVAWSYSTKIWDVAAGILLVREAGGVVTAPDGSPFLLERPQFIAAANPRLHAALRALVARAGA